MVRCSSKRAARRYIWNEASLDVLCIYHGSSVTEGATFSLQSKIFSQVSSQSFTSTDEVRISFVDFVGINQSTSRDKRHGPGMRISDGCVDMHQEGAIMRIQLATYPQKLASQTAENRGPFAV